MYLPKPMVSKPLVCGILMCLVNGRTNGAYAAVIPKWAASMLLGDDVFINGDGETSRDFCFIDNAVQANLLAATAAEDAKTKYTTSLWATALR